MKYDAYTEDIRIVGISWERIFLHFDVRNVSNAAIVGFKLNKGESNVTLKYYTNSDDLWKITINITAVDGRTFLDNGNWTLMAITDQGGGRLADITCIAEYDLAYHIDEYSRIFRYNKGRRSYNCSFSTWGLKDNKLRLILCSHFMVQNDNWKKISYIDEASEKGQKFAIRKTVNVLLMRIYYLIVSKLVAKNGHRVLFMSETKEYLWGNLKYINDRMMERGMDKEFEISYNFRHQVGTRSSNRSWLSLIHKIAKQDFIFVDDYVPLFGFLKLDHRTKLIQVWHAGEGFKSVGYSRFGKVGTPHPVGNCHKKYDYAVVGSEKLIHTYEEVFGIEREALLPLGMARLDGFLNSDKIDAYRHDFYEQHTNLKGKKLILFAPTYRGGNQKNAHYDYDKLDLGCIYEVCGEEYVWAFKMHPFIQLRPDIPEAYKDRIVDFSNVQNINDLYYVTDLLITDYSSNYYEYALMRKPVLFYTYDRQFYEISRGVHKKVKDTAPGKVCDTFEELITSIENEDFEYEKIEKFVEANFGNYNGHASDMIIDTILLGKVSDFENE